ncbi:hypothetical protein HZH68_010127 [Vespula germanica]|uniref:Uncharacterized protein n=1 Tax=Vespula germanica TaxID=30212 RepID=A0A834N4L8_VESGE|nr:hypothetical protein HZH68_010127 [Vespula germanica]
MYTARRLSTVNHPANREIRAKPSRSLADGTMNTSCILVVVVVVVEEEEKEEEEVPQLSEKKRLERHSCSFNEHLDKPFCRVRRRKTDGKSSTSTRNGSRCEQECPYPELSSFQR